jgi:hypothetical protein
MKVMDIINDIYAKTYLYHRAAFMELREEMLHVRDKMIEKTNENVELGLEIKAYQDILKSNGIDYEYIRKNDSKKDHKAS